ncbi:MAG: hypothetical protein V4447_01310 [Pseudomonadota bacterium]
MIADMDRTYISDIKRGVRNVSLANTSAFFSLLLSSFPTPTATGVPIYRVFA